MPLFMKDPFSLQSTGESDSASAFATVRAPRSAASRRLSPRVVVQPEGAPSGGVDADGVLHLTQCSSEGDAFVFGDGSHPTTRLCAGAVDLLCRQRAGRAVLDVGTGTGILARVARARGASFVAGTDIDAASLATARRNAALDATALPIHFGDAAPDAWGARFDLVVANILADPLMGLAPRLADALVPGGTLLVSGFTRLQSPFLRQAFEPCGLDFDREAHDDEWTLLMFARTAAGRGARMPVA
jgi:ribosomal protein L11 methyltransferase